MIRADSQLLLLSTLVNIFNYLNMLELEKKSELLSFFYSFNCVAQQAIKKARRGAKEV